MLIDVSTYLPCATSVAIDHVNSPELLVHIAKPLVTFVAAVGGTLYRDQVTIQAGMFTPFIWLFAQLFYRHRQRRWRQLARTGFNYGKL
jgi:hypothetical protein